AGREPLDRVVPVARLLLVVLVERDAAGAAGSADVEPAQREAAAGEVLATTHVRVPAPVVLAVRDHLEDRRKAGVRGVAGTGQRTPDVGRQLHPVADRDPDVPVGRDLVAGRARRAGGLGVGGGHVGSLGPATISRCTTERGTHQRSRPPARGRVIRAGPSTRTQGSWCGTTKSPGR